MPVPADCPPIEAEPSEGVFYRLVPGTLGVGEQTTADCWQAPHRARKGQCAGRTEICACHAFSVALDMISGKPTGEDHEYEVVIRKEISVDAVTGEERPRFRLLSIAQSTSSTDGPES